MNNSLVAPEVDAVLGLQDVKKPQDNRVTLMFADKIWDWIDEGVNEEGFNDNVSQYLAHLVRRDHEERERRAMLVREQPTHYGRKPVSSSSSEDIPGKITASIRRDLSKRGSSPSTPKGKK